MSKKILVLTGSPRKGGNSDLLADAFIQGAARSGHIVERFDAGRKKIMGCKACNTCFKKGNACSFDDDFNSLASLLEKADAVVFVTPLYWFTFTAQLKAAIDKMYSFTLVQRPLPIKECMLLACAETENEAEFNGLITSYQHIAAYQEWQDKGFLIATKVSEIGDILQTDALAKAERLGREF